MSAHRRLDFAGCGRLGRGLGLGIDSHTADVPWVDGSTGHGVPSPFYRRLGVHHQEIIVILELCYDLPESVLVVIILATRCLVLNFVDDNALWELEGHWIDVICIQNYLGDRGKGCDFGSLYRSGFGLSTFPFLGYGHDFGSSLSGGGHL